jgi:hypothetical protein
MKYFLLIIALTVFVTESNAQEKVIVSGGKISEDPIPNQLKPGDEYHKFVIRDTIAKSVDVFFYIEEYEKNKKDSNYLWLTHSFKSKLVFEVAPDIKFLDKEMLELASNECSERLNVVLMFPERWKGRFVCSTEGYKFKWRVFAESKRKENVPLIFCYEEKENEITIEKKFETLFGNADITMTKEEVIRKIRPVIEKYWMMSYNLKPQK